jgi:hypothetical protein
MFPACINDVSAGLNKWFKANLDLILKNEVHKYRL